MIGGEPAKISEEAGAEPVAEIATNNSEAVANFRTEAAKKEAVEANTSLQDGAVVEGVMAYVRSTNTIDIISGEIEECLTIYEVEVQKDETGSFPEGEIILVAVPITSSIQLAVGETTEIDIKYDSEAQYPYSLG